MKFRSFLNVLIAVVLVLLSIGVSGFFWLVSQSPLSILQEGRSSPDAAMFVPRQAPVMVSLLVNPDRLESFRVAAAPPGDRRRARAELNQLKQSLLGWTGLTYEQDLQPWLDNELTLAVTAPDFDRNQENGQQPGYLLAMASKDPERAREFLQLFWQKQAIAGVDLVFEQYAGVKIIHGNAASSEVDVPEPLRAQPLATALVGDRFVLFANHPKVLRDAINNVQAPELSLGSTDSYQEAVAALPSRQVGFTFVNLPQLTQWLEKSQSTRKRDRPTDPIYESLVVAFQLDRQGLIGDTALLTAAGKKLPATKPLLTKPVEALRFVPAASSVTAAGVDLEQFWEQFDAGVEGYPQIAVPVEQFVTDLQAQWGLERSDLFNWAQGEFALALVPQTNRSQPDWIFVAEKSAAATAEIDRLDMIAQQRGLSLGSLTLENQTVSAWTKLSAAAGKRDAVGLNAEVQGVHATVGNYEILASSIAAMAQALQSSDQPLVNTAEFQQATAALESRNDGYLYLDWQPLQKLVSRQFPLVRLVKLAGKPLFDNLRSITVTSYGSEDTIRRGAIFLRLKS